MLVAMGIHTQARDEAYDVVVIGAGIGGLTAAAVLAKAGRKVLVVEQGGRPGGYAQALDRGKYRFDLSLHMVAGCGRDEGGRIDCLLAGLGVQDHCQFVPVDPLYTAAFPELRFTAPAGAEAYLDAHAGRFPRQARGFRRLLELCSVMKRECLGLPGPLRYRDLLRASWREPRLPRYLKATLASVMSRCLDDRRAQAVFAALWPYCGLPPSRVSFALWAAMLMTYLEDGAFYCRGSFENLANALVTALKNYGGELLLESRVRRILVDGRRARGVVLADGRRIAAATVISNADATQTFEELVGPEYLPGRLLRRLRRLEPSLSALVVYLATDLDVHTSGCGYETVIHKTWDHEEAYRQVCEGQPGGICLTVPTVIDPSLAPPGEHLVIASSLMPYRMSRPWAEEEERYADLMLGEIEPHLPGIRDHVLCRAVVSPATRHRLTLNRQGALYGWALTPKQVGFGRLPQRTPIGGLYLCSDWVQPGSSIYGVTMAGLQTAQQILGCRSEQQLWQALRV